MVKCSLCGKKILFGKTEDVRFGFVEHFCRECYKHKMGRTQRYYELLDQREKILDEFCKEVEKIHPNPFRHPEADKPYFHYCVEVDGKYYAGTIKEKPDGSYHAELYDDPFNPTKTTLVIDGKEKRKKIIRDDRGTVECIVLYGDLKIKEAV